MSAPTLKSYSPQSPDDLVGEFPISLPDEIERACERARSAQREWWSVGAARRAAALAAAAVSLRSLGEDAASLIVREVGKPAAEAAGEVARTTSILEYYSQACFASIGEQYPPSAGGLLFTERRPYGVATLITPWNFPLAIPAWKAAPALVAGNAVVLKPSPESSACAELLKDCLAPHLPEGLLTVLHGGADVGRAVLEFGDVISFTGSARAGRSVAARAGERAVPAQCEMGGQNAAIIFDDADPGSAAAMIAAAAMGYAGQKCTATRRVILVGDNAEFLDALVAAVSAITPGAPAAAATTVGPVITDTARDRVLEAVRLGRDSGGTVLAQGAAVPDQGWFVRPTLIDGLAPEHALNREETFGPLVTILHAQDGRSAAQLANSVRYGLVTSIHGSHLSRVLATAAEIDTGMVKVNAPTTGVDFYAPFGGEKESSFGAREQGIAGLHFYSSTRTVTIAA